MLCIQVPLVDCLYYIFPKDNVKSTTEHCPVGTWFSKFQGKDKNKQKCGSGCSLVLQPSWCRHETPNFHIGRKNRWVWPLTCLPLFIHQTSLRISLPPTCWKSGSWSSAEIGMGRMSVSDPVLHPHGQRLRPRPLSLQQGLG